MSFFDRLFGLFLKRDNAPTLPLPTDEMLEADTWRPILRNYSHIDSSYRPLILPAAIAAAPGCVIPTMPSGAQSAPDVIPLRAAPKKTSAATKDVLPTNVASSSKAAQRKSTHCPHGNRRREFCPVCNPDGYAYNFSDWTKD